MNAAVLTVSDGVHHGTREDRSGDTLAELLAATASQSSDGSSRTSATRSRPRSSTSPAEAPLC